MTLTQRVYGTNKSAAGVVHLEVIVAVLHVRAEGGQQLDAQGGDVVGAPLLQVGEANALVAPGLQGSTRGRERSLTASLEASTGFDESFFGVTLRKGAFLAGPAVRLNSSLRSMSSSRKTSSAGPSSTSSCPCTQQEESLLLSLNTEY